MKALVTILLGAFAGLGSYTMWYGKGHSYLSDDPAACANCHIMREQYDRWSRASHKAVATCNDCHTPRPFVAKWSTKLINGWNHGYAFTFDTYRDPIVITPRNARITRDSCLGCHAQLVAEISPPHAPWKDTLDCIACHRGVGHAH